MGVNQDARLENMDVWRWSRLRSALPEARSAASCRLWQRWQSAARLRRPAASGRLSKTWAAVRTTFEPVSGCASPCSAPHHSQRPLARTNRTNRDLVSQSRGYLDRISGRIGIVQDFGSMNAQTIATTQPMKVQPAKKFKMPIAFFCGCSRFTATASGRK